MSNKDKVTDKDSGPRFKGVKKVYSPVADGQTIIDVFALYQMYHNVEKVSRMTGVPSTTINDWVNPARKTPEWIKKRAELIEDYDLRLEATKQKYMAAIGNLMDKALVQVNEKLPDSSAAQAATIFGILFDKGQILTGNGPNGGVTNNFFMDTSNMSDDDKLSIMQRAVDRNKSRAENADNDKKTQVIETEAEVIEEGGDSNE